LSWNYTRRNDRSFGTELFYFSEHPPSATVEREQVVVDEPLRTRRVIKIID
jgi:hypothetical protein